MTGGARGIGEAIVRGLCREGSVCLFTYVSNISKAEALAQEISESGPNRHGLNAAFMPMLITAGMTSAITNPLHPELMQSVRGADVVMGHDPQCAAWIRAYREPVPEGSDQRARRTTRRRG